MTDRSRAIYHAKQAYRLWLMNGIETAGFMVQGIDGGTYAYFDNNGYWVDMRSNGAVIRAYLI